MSTFLKWAGIIVVVCFLGLIVFWRFFMLPYLQAESEMPENAAITITAQEDGMMLLSWDEADCADRYLVQVLYSDQGEEREAEILFSESCPDNVCELPALPTGREVTLRINTEVICRQGWKESVRAGDTPAEYTFMPSIPTVGELNVEINTEEKTAALSWEYRNGDRYRLYKVSDNEQSLIRTIEAGRTVITFGDGCDLEMPGHEDTYSFMLDVYRQSPGILFYGTPYENISVCREDFLGSELALDCADEGDNVFTLSWNETKGEKYEVQLLNDATAEWETLAELDPTDNRSYSTGHLSPFTEYTLRVVALGGQTLPESKFAALPAEVRLSPGASAIYATVWPLKELEVYKDVDQFEVAGSVEAASAFCVLDEIDGFFKIRYSDSEYGYINSNYCLINLPDYMGDLCSYDIANSYSAIYMVHEFEIPGVTDTVIKGYENIRMNSGDFLVPLLYPSARRLVSAAQAALADGYRLKIYDAYRPNQATRSVYDRTLSIIEEPIPEETFTGKPMFDLPQAGEDEMITYRRLMTNDTYSLNNFLAAGASFHNMGIALDLTLVKLSGEELKMQTSMHDLSWYSDIYSNNANANLLAAYMKDAGFVGLVSEWWHFQDNETRDSLGLSTFMRLGVSPECWMADDDGWEYREADGESVQ